MSQPPDISQYQPPKRHRGWIAAIIAVAVIIALVLVARRITSEPDLSQSPMPTPVATPSSATTPTPIPASVTAVASSVPFSSKDNSTEGTWSIDDVSWGPGSVTLTVTIEVTRGSLSDYTFFIMENESTNIHEASLPPTGTLGDTISPGHKVHGTVTIDCPRADATVMFTHGSGMSSPISALTIKA